MCFIGNFTFLVLICLSPPVEANAGDLPSGPPRVEGPPEVTWRWVAGTKAFVDASVIGREPMSFTWYDGANQLHG